MPKYKVLCGQHIDNHPSHAGDHVYAEGDIIDTDKDLCRFNAIGMQPKFERLHEDGRLSKEEWDRQEREKAAHPEAQQLKATVEQPTRAPVAEQPSLVTSKDVPPAQQPFNQQRQQAKGR